MRVITGTARGFRLKTLSGQDTRPTTDRVKEALFSILQFDIPGRRVLDLFAGSGQLGIEALSRGAQGCTFVDQNAEAVAVIKENVAGARLSAGAQILCEEAVAFLTQSKEQYQLVFLDPPYQSGLLKKALELLPAHLAPGAIIACETDDRTTLPEEVGACRLSRTYRYGKICLWVYRYREEEETL